MKSKTHLAKAIEASRGKSTKTLRGLVDQAAKNIITDKQILARIIKNCVEEAAKYTIEELERLLPGKIEISVLPVTRDDEQAAGRDDVVRQDNTEDGTIDEGTVYFDIIFTLVLPGEKPVAIIINVELQNRTKLPYPVETRAEIYTNRLVSRQGTNYAHIKKVYSIWLLADSPGEDGNDITRLVRAKQNMNVPDQPLEPAPKAAQLSEIWFLTLGDPDKTANSLLRILDIIFTNDLETKEKVKRLEESYGLEMSTEISKEMEDMDMLELALESKARKQGEATGMIRAALQLQAAKDTILQMLTTHFEGDEQEAATTFTEYMTENPKEGAYLQI